MEARLSSDGRGGCSSGNIMSMVTSGKWWKIKTRYLSLLLDRGYNNRKGK